MTTPTLRQVRAALADAISRVDGLRVSPTMPNQVHPPVAIVELEAAVYHQTMQIGSVMWEFRVTLLVGTNVADEAEEKLDSYLHPAGDSSVRQVLEEDPTLGGIVQDVTVREVRGVQGYEVGGVSYWGARFTVEVQA